MPTTFGGEPKYTFFTNNDMI
ncbi:hypothetical protein [Staphylococcus aureus]